jgi:hypothetical protein
MELRGSLLCSQEPPTGPYLEPDETNPHPLTQTIVYYSYYYWISGLCPLPDIPNRNWIYFCPQVKMCGVPTQTGPLEIASLNHWTHHIPQIGP